MRAGIRVTRTLAELEVRADHQPDGRGDMVDVDNDIDWHETHVLLKAAFPLAATEQLRHVRDSLRHHRAADHAQQQLGEGAV